MIIVEYWACCDKCSDSQVMVDSPVPHSKKEAVAQAVTQGWKVKGRQLICPRCQEPHP